MAYSVTGTAGNDVLNQSGDTGPGTIVGLAGDDTISSGTGSVQAFGNSGNDSVFLQTGNSGTVNGGSENDTVFTSANTGSLQLFGNEGADIISLAFSTAPQTIVGGNDSNDGNDSLIGGLAGDFVFGNGGNDLIFDPGGNDTFVAGFGNDSLEDLSGGNNLIFGNQGNDTVAQTGGEQTGFAGLGNDSVGFSGASAQVFGNEGADTFSISATGSVTLVGGNDSADGADSLVASANSAIAFGNGGGDTFTIGVTTSLTIVGGQGGDSASFGGATLVFGNEGNDTINAQFNPGSATVFGGVGNDTVAGGTGRETIQGNENNDTIAGGAAIDTIAGGSGNDVFGYAAASEDGDNAAGGGPVELITDLNWAEDKVDTATQVTFATNTGAGTGVDLNASANNAIAAGFALAGGGAAVVAAQFTFGGRTYLAIDQATFGTFLDTDDLLIDITGVTGAIATSNFV
jgi:Ca2+-binding RTX toxin-like protein